MTKKEMLLKKKTPMIVKAVNRAVIAIVIMTVAKKKSKKKKSQSKITISCKCMFFLQKEIGV